MSRETTSSESLREEIGLAQDGDTIVVDPGLNGGTIQLAGGNGPVELLVARNVTIQGPGAGQLAIDANYAGRAFEIASSSSGESWVSLLQPATFFA